jgi:two-component system sensor histidine kinase BaeS
MESVTSWRVMPMTNFHSITYKIAGVMFVLLVGIVFFLISYADQRLADLFHNYLLLHGGKLSSGDEVAFVQVFHDALVWIGLVNLIVGLLACYWLARSITIPLRRLSSAVEKMEQGDFQVQAEIMSRDEIGYLALVFNRMAAALAANQRLRKRLLMDIVHELNTPVTVVQGNLEAILDGVIPNDEEQLKSMYEETSHLGRMIQDLRVLSLAEARQLELELAPTDLNVLLQQVLRVFRPMAAEKSVVIRYQEASLPVVCVDQKRVYQIFHNLMTNALRYTDCQGSIAVETGIVEMNGAQWVCVNIEDTGIGIATQDLPYIFDRFYRTDRSRSRKSGGSGLGLAIVRELILLHNGKITVRSMVGKGSVFSVLLPVVSAYSAGSDKTQ